ncbi:MAG: aminotransferase class I/II-fold pyridoxal phosphate-dependent enzyme [Marmoricola sp.]
MPWPTPKPRSFQTPTHASLIDGCRLSRARVTVTPHGDVAAVEDALARASEARKIVLTESIFSVLGDAAPLPQLAEICQRHDAVLVVDEAHGLGVRGDGGGLVKEFGLNGHPNVILTATLSKSLGAQGGAVLAPAALLDHLVNTSRAFIFDTGLTPLLLQRRFGRPSCSSRLWPDDCKSVVMTLPKGWG